MLLREIVTCFTQLCSDLKTELEPEFVFKGKDRRTHITSPKGDIINGLHKDLTELSRFQV